MALKLLVVFLLCLVNFIEIEAAFDDECRDVSECDTILQMVNQTRALDRQSPERIRLIKTLRKALCRVEIGEGNRKR